MKKTLLLAFLVSWNVQFTKNNKVDIHRYDKSKTFDTLKTAKVFVKWAPSDWYSCTNSQTGETGLCKVGDFKIEEQKPIKEASERSE